MTYICTHNLRRLAIFIAAAYCCLSLAFASSLNWVESMPFSPQWSRVRIPKWRNGSLVDIQTDSALNPTIWLLGRQGSRTVQFSIPGASTLSILDWDLGVDGKVALSGSAFDRDGRASNFLAVIGSDGLTSVIIRTDRYVPSRIVFAPDGTLWAAGFEWMPSGDLGVFRHFDASGLLLNSFMPQSKMNDHLMMTDIMNGFTSSADRIAWYSPRASRYIELTVDGTTILDAHIAPMGTRSEGYGFALTDRDETYLSAFTGSSALSRAFAVYKLNKTTLSWAPIMQRQPPLGTRGDFGHIRGADGAKLVLGGDHRINFYDIGQ